MRALILSVIALLFAACGGNADPGATEAMVEPASTCRVSVLLNGDSTMWGFEPFGGGARAATTPESALQAEMDARFPGLVTVSTGAVSGTTSTDALTQPTNADVILYNPGINDYGERMPEETYRANLRALAAVPGAMFVTPLPVKVEPMHFAGVMREVAAETGTPLIDSRAYAESLPGWWQLAPDGVHPNSEGYRVLAKEVLMPALQPLVAERCNTPSPP